MARPPIRTVAEANQYRSAGVAVRLRFAEVLDQRTRLRHVGARSGGGGSCDIIGLLYAAAISGYYCKAFFLEFLFHPAAFYGYMMTASTQ